MADNIEVKILKRSFLSKIYSRRLIVNPLAALAKREKSVRIFQFSFADSS